MVENCPRIYETGARCKDQDDMGGLSQQKSTALLLLKLQYSGKFRVVITSFCRTMCK